MKKRVKINIPVIIITLVIVIVLSSMAIFFIFPKSNTLDLSEGGKSITGDVTHDSDGLIDNYLNLSPGYKIIIAGEWLVVIIVIIIILVKGKHRFSKERKKEKEISNELTTEKIKSKYHKSKPETDLDVLHKILKENKSLSMSAISEIFKINNDIAMDWCKILEEGNLATIYYPIVGSPKVIINEEDKGKEDKVSKDKGKEDKVSKDKGKEDKVSKDKGKEDKVSKDKGKSLKIKEKKIRSLKIKIRKNEKRGKKEE